MKIFIKESQEHLINEINHIANNSNVTICSLEDFKSLVSNMGIDDNNVERYAGQYCFIEIGSSYARIAVEKEYSNVNMINGQEYSPKDFYKNQQWYFKNEHSNVIKLEFDDNQEIDKSTPNQGKDPSWRPKYGPNDAKYKNALKNMKATAVALRKNEVKPEVWDKLGYKDNAKKVFYYKHGKGVDDKIINRLKKFVDDNLALNPNVKFVLHCRAGQSRSGAVGVYLARKIGQYSEEFLSEYGDQIKMPRMKDNGKRSKSYPHQNMLNGLSKAEGWEDLSGKRQATKAAERWWYPEMMNYLEKYGK